MNNENFHFYIKVRTGLNVQPKLIHDELYSVFHDQGPSCNIINDAKVFGKNVELHSVVISIDTKMFFFLLERARKVLQKNIFSRSNIAHLAI